MRELELLLYLRYLSLQNNRLSGTIPASLSMLLELRYDARMYPCPSLCNFFTLD